MKSAVIRVLGVALGVALVLALWFWASDIIVELLDFNLKVIKWACSLLPVPYNTRVESALRVALHADKALVLAEGTWLVGGMLHILFRRKTA